jgi:predicted glutamine amidotransferase
MCRLFGMLSPEPVTARFWLLDAPDSVLDQSLRNPDGTGLAHYVGSEPVVDKQPIAAYEDRQFAAEARHVHSHLFVAHVRHATRGEPRPENTQPFSHGPLVFAHNGTIEGLEELAGSLGLFLGDTDSERYFVLLQHHIREVPDTGHRHPEDRRLDQGELHLHQPQLPPGRRRLPLRPQAPRHERALRPTPRSRGGSPGLELLRHPCGGLLPLRGHPLRL